MTDLYDFERAWLTKFSRCLDRVAGAEVRQAVLAGSEGLTSDSSRQAVIAWSQGAMERLEAMVDAECSQRVMVGCACQYPRSGLQDVRQAFDETGDVGVAHQMLQERFDSFLRSSLELPENLAEEVLHRGWGLAGVRLGNRIIATKIPKSGYLEAYLQESDPQKRRQYYCHCPRIRDVLKTAETLSPTYCYCGAGYYKGIWEEILQEPVQVEVLASVLAGDEVCKIAVHLPLQQ